jgi:hypothetical protein
MIPVLHEGAGPVPPPDYQRALRTCRPALHLDARTLVPRLHLLRLCHLAV